MTYRGLSCFFVAKSEKNNEVDRARQKIKADYRFNWPNKRIASLIRDTDENKKEIVENWLPRYKGLNLKILASIFCSLIFIIRSNYSQINSMLKLMAKEQAMTIYPQKFRRFHRFVFNVLYLQLS